jgi:hypothetical protein
MMGEIEEACGRIEHLVESGYLPDGLKRDLELLLRVVKRVSAGGFRPRDATGGLSRSSRASPIRASRNAPITNPDDSEISSAKRMARDCTIFGKRVAFCSLVSRQHSICCVPAGMNELS